MKEKDTQEERSSAIMILERRSQRQNDLSSAEVMRILRKRAAKATRKSGAAGPLSAADSGFLNPARKGR